jgi:S1-C subfamily serine protease
LETRLTSPASRFIRILLPAFLFSIATFGPSAWARQQGTNNAQTQASPFRLINSVSGSKEVMKGAEETIVDPRTVFRVPEDSQVVVAFELEGPTGAHHLQGRWRNPAGEVVSVGDVDMQTYTPKFFCYFTLTFPDSVTPGLWAIEVEIDGHPSATHTFEILAKPKPAPPPMTPPTAADVYKQGVDASVFIDNQDSDGQIVRQGSGFFIGKNLLLTAFQIIDGANSLQIDFPDGSNATVNQVLAWNRYQDWAILEVDAPKVAPLERAKAGSWKVGDVCYLFGAPNESSRTIQNVGITGVQESAEAGERLSTSWVGESLSIGSPLLDDYGRVVGILGGSLLPGVESLRRPGDRQFMQPGIPLESSSRLLVVPISVIPEQFGSAQPTTLSALAAQGLFIKPISRDTQVMNGVLCRNFQEIGRVALSPQNQTFEFSRASNSLAVVITWAPDTKTKSVMQFRIYDLDNRLVQQTRPEKIDLERQVTAYSGVRIPLSSLKPGMYRIDLLVGNLPQWREFFRVRE